MGGRVVGRSWIATAVLTLCVTTSGVATAASTPRHSLAAKQIQRIVKMTGYHGLRSHRFDVADTFRAGGAKTVVVRLDRARLGVTRKELRRQLALATRLAGDRPAFTTKIRLRHGSRQTITFHVAPANVLTPHAPYIRYLIFTPRREQLSGLTRPQQIPNIQALTVIDAAHRINVTLLQDRAKGATWGSHIPAARLFAMIESLNTSSFVYLTPKTINRMSRRHVNVNKLLAFGREIWSNSLGFAILAAQTGTSYPAYARQAKDMRFGFYRKYDLRYLTVSAAEYRFVQSWK
jgi:hypothetical protein